MVVVVVMGWRVRFASIYSDTEDVILGPYLHGDESLIQLFHLMDPRIGFLFPAHLI
jgi:hypothetical protein